MKIYTPLCLLCLSLLACSGDGGSGKADGAAAQPDSQVGTSDTTPGQPDQGMTPQDFCAKVRDVGCCDPTHGVVWCDSGQVQSLACSGSCGWDSQNGIYDCEMTGEDPSGQHPKACPQPVPLGCQPSCPAGKCGMDDGCGKTCGCKTGEICSNGSCVPDTGGCTDGQKRCNGDDVEICQGGTWVKKETCPNGCLSGVCVGGTCNCPIPAQGIKVTFPYVSLKPPTVVKVQGSCYVGTTTTPCGYKTVSVLNILEHSGGTASITDPFGGGYIWVIDFPITQAKPSSSDHAALSSATGIATSHLGAGSSETIRVGGSLAAPVPVGYTLPTGVTAEAFLGTSTTSKGYIRFQASTQSALSPVLTQLGSGGITVDVEVGQFSGSSTYTYRVKLTKSSFAIEKISL
jgi:hypothetical protein